ncbi:MAG: TolC family protein [Bacteroidetes bacterium]|jgi:outer membrane protein TolC|nr:TolC family protein [Bacteroidota bacterium]
MKKVKTYWIGAITLLWAQLAVAQSTFTIEEAVDYALKNHSSIKNAMVGMQDAEWQIKEIKYSGMPQINGQFGYTYNAIVPTQLIDAKNFNPQAAEGEVVKFKFGVPWGGQAGIGLNQLIFDATWLVGLRAADTYRLMASQDLEKSKVVIAESVRKAYYSALVAEQRGQTLDLNISRLDSVIAQTEQFVKQGFVEKIDVDRLNVQRNNLISEKQKLNNLIGLTYQLLKFQMSYPQDASLILKDKLSEENVKLIRSVVAEDADPNNRIEFRQLATNRKLIELNQERYQKAYLPSLNLSASLGAGHSNTQFNPFERWFGSSAITLGVRVPIYDSGLKRVQIERQKLNIIKIDNTVEMLKESFKLENAQAKINLKNGFETLDAMTRNMDLASEVLRVSKIKYQQGVGSNMEVVNAESDLKQAQNNYFSALYDVLIAKVDLDKSQGKLIK